MILETPESSENREEVPQTYAFALLRKQIEKVEESLERLRATTPDHLEFSRLDADLILLKEQKERLGLGITPAFIEIEQEVQKTVDEMRATYDANANLFMSYMGALQKLLRQESELLQQATSSKKQ